MKNRFALTSAMLALCGVFALNTIAKPRPPGVPFPESELKGWRFDIPDYVNAEDMGAHIATNLWLADSWSGYALDMRAEGSLLQTPAMRNTNHANVAKSVGTIRLWYSPITWASASVGGTGPGDWATLFELVQTNTVDHPFGLVLGIDATGTNLVAVANTETGTVTLAQAPLAWTTGVWHQIAFVYWTNGVSLVIDDTPETLSATVPVWPNSSIWNQSAFSLGSAFDGTQLAQGQLDEIHTFGFALSTNYLTWSYELYAPIAALGPLPDELDGGGLNSVLPSPCDPCSGGGGGDTNSYVGGWTTNAGLKFSCNPGPYILNKTNYITMLDEAIPTKAYQIFQATQILGSTLITTNVFWKLLTTNSPIGVSNFSLAISTNQATSFYVAAAADDFDGDGWSDAFENLITHTDPKVFNDSDGDGLSENFFTVSFDFQNQTNGNLNSGPQGSVIRGPGFRVWAAL
jgi:hypothetical protein